MEFDFEQFKILSREPFIKLITNNLQFFKICEKKNTQKIFTLIMMDGSSAMYADKLKTHLQCQSVSKEVIKVKGFKQMDSVDQFQFKVERTAWLVEDIETTLEHLITDSRLHQVFQRHQFSQSPSSEQLPPPHHITHLPLNIVMQLLHEISYALEQLQEEEIAITSLTVQSIVVTATKQFKILDMSGAVNTMGMQASINRQIQGIPHYFDPETYRASLEGEVFITQNYYKASVYALGLIMLEVCTLQVISRRLTAQEVFDTIGIVERHYDTHLGAILRGMLAPMRADRPDCIQLQDLIHGMRMSPPLLRDDRNDLLYSESGTGLQYQFQQLNIHDHPDYYPPPLELHPPPEHYNIQNSAIQITQSEYIMYSPNRNVFPKFPGEPETAPPRIDFKMTESHFREGETQGVHLTETLRNHIKLFQAQARQQSKQELQIDESSDYIEEISYQPITFSQLRQELQVDTRLSIKLLDVKQIKVDHNKLLGRGTEGVVYLCSVGHCQNLAVKTMIDIDNQWVKDILITTNQVQNRKIKGIFHYDYYAIEPTRGSDINCNLYMVSRRMRCDLGFAKRELSLTMHEKLFICKQLASVLAELENQIIHGDLKPSNILLDAENHINLIDFGMSRVLSKAHNCLHESNSHTYLYSSPEQVLFKNVHSKSDIWSFGIILYEMFTDHWMSQEIIFEMGMYDENKSGCLKVKQPIKDEIHRVIFELIAEMTRFNFEERPSIKDIAHKLQTLQVAPPHQTKVIVHPQPTYIPTKQNKAKHFASNQLMVVGKQIKGQASEHRFIQYQAQTHITKKEPKHHNDTKYPTSITKK